MVFGLGVTYPVRSDWRIGLAFGRVSGLTALSGEARWLMRREGDSRLVPSLAAGAEQYFLTDGGADATPVGVHAALGLDWYMDAPVSFGVELGAMHTFGTSDGSDVKVFSVENDFSSAIFNVGARYHF
jgi:hypothetical protein